MKGRIQKIISDQRFILALFILFAIAAGTESLSHAKYNNYIIFERSFEHLKNNQDLYVMYPQEHGDLFKYTPTFAVFFGVFGALPDWLGLQLWNLINALCLLMAFYYLPGLSSSEKGLISLVVLIELMTSLQNEQSNALMAGLMILTFGLLERKKPFWAMMTLVFSVFIKMFGIAGMALLIFYPDKVKNLLYIVFWTLLFLMMPLFFVDRIQIITLYGSYLDLLIKDFDASYGYSVMGWLQSWRMPEFNKSLVIGIGLALLFLPFVKIRKHLDFYFRYLFLSSVLIWVVIFNHKAESPTYIIAMSGVALWFVKCEKNMINTVLFTLAYLFTTLSPTDLFPEYLRVNVVEPYVLKALPCILIWLKIIFDAMILNKEPSPTVNA